MLSEICHLKKINFIANPIIMSKGIIYRLGIIAWECHILHWQDATHNSK